MKKDVLKNGIILILLLAIVTTSVKAQVVSFTTTTSQKDAQLDEKIGKYISEINNVRKQFQMIAESGYKNHMEGKSNEDNIKMVNVYLKQIKGIRQEVEKFSSEYKENVFINRKISTLAATTLYLESMGQNLIEYLSTKDLSNQYDFFNIHVQINSFIINILASLSQDIY